MIRRDLTAMARRALSRPVQIAIEHEVISQTKTWLDYGCGRGFDVDALTNLGWKVKGWDPVHRKSTKKTPAKVVSLVYVVNVIEREDERVQVLLDAWKLAKECLVVAARLDHERDEAHVRPFADGWLTSKGTFQRFFEQSDLRNWIEIQLRSEAVVAAPGVFYVFKKTADLEEFKARRYRIRIPAPWIRDSDKKFKEHADLLEPLIEFVASHGRVPKDEEFESQEELKKTFGSIRQAFRIVQNVTDREEWIKIADRRRIDVLVHLALRQFDGDYMMKDLPKSSQYDVRTFFQSFKKANLLASKLLFSAGSLDAIQLACRSSSVGKLTPSALYIHKEALHLVPALLRVYEACARRIVGEIEEANLVKLHRDAKMVSYLSYPDFWENPHPPLASSFSVNLVEQKFDFRKYSNRKNRPILHRKETFISPSHPHYDKFSNLSIEEENVGLFQNPELIGHEEAWRKIMADKGLIITNHQIFGNQN